MIFDEIVLENFGPYKGRHAVSLAPATKKKPIVLFGGLNGAGKTTLLDAFRLIFHGKLARCASRNGQTYSGFLRQRIHRAADASEGASLELQFRVYRGGQEHVYRVRRSWRATNTAISEKVDVLRNKSQDTVLSQAWAEHAEELIPLSICPLFFFDGEKIEEFADLENSGRLLSTAFDSLLGIDIVNRLAADLTVLGRRTINLTADTGTRAEAVRLVNEIAELQEQRNAVSQKQAGLQNDLDAKTKLLEELEEQFRKEGGLLYERRHQLEQEHQDCLNAITDIEDQLRRIATGAAPLLLVTGLLRSCSEQAQREYEAGQQKTLQSTLLGRDGQLLDIARQHRASKRIVDALSGFLQEDRDNRSKNSACDVYLHLRDDTRRQMDELIHLQLPRISAETRGLLVRLESLHNTLTDVERSIAGVPRNEAIDPLLVRREETRRSVEDLTMQIRVLEHRVEELDQSIGRKRAELAKRVEAKGQASTRQKDTQRLLNHAGKARHTLGLFRERVIRSHIARLEQMIVEGYRSLLRKQSLVTEMRIDPETFMVSLYGRNGRSLPTEVLSAGERQLLAISMLWGLAKASGRPLPTIIDTPLGRLDSTHRLHMVERYLPSASHQVLLLSTDKEVGERYYEKLKPYIGHAYTLDYDENTDTTRVTPGYFWE